MPESEESAAETQALQEQAAERLSEDEALYRGLSDDESGPLLNWGIAEVGRRLQQDPVRFEEIMGAVRDAMRTVSQLVAQRNEGDAAGFTAEVRALIQPTESSVVAQGAAAAAQAATLARLSGAELVERLAELVSSAAAGPTSPAEAAETAAPDKPTEAPAGPEQAAEAATPEKPAETVTPTAPKPEATRLTHPQAKKSNRNG